MFLQSGLMLHRRPVQDGNCDKPEAADINKLRR